MIPLHDFVDLAERQVSFERPKKRLRTTRIQSHVSHVDSAMKHVADIVLILSGLGLIRAGQKTTDIERKLQAEAYGHLGFLVQRFAPKDLILPKSIESLVEDLALRRPEGQEVKTFSQILESFQPPPIQTVVVCSV